VEHVFLQRAETRAVAEESAIPGKLRRDLITLVCGMDEQARTGRLPPYLPQGADVTALSRTVQVWLQVRTGQGGDDPSGQTGSSVCWLPVERAGDSEPPRPWPGQV
jgi:hypothetical protein